MLHCLAIRKYFRQQKKKIMVNENKSLCPLQFIINATKGTFSVFYFAKITFGWGGFIRYCHRLLRRDAGKIAGVVLMAF